MNRFLVIIFICVGAQLFGQSSEKYTSKYAPFYVAEELFNKEQFGAARYEFRKFIDSYGKANDPLQIKALYYEGLSALELFNNDGVDLLEEFNRNYPESIYRKVIYFKLGKYFYQKKDFKEAIVWFSKLRNHDVETDEVDEFYFKVGYAHFQLENYPEANSAFYEIKEGESQYAAPALYYYSHISYQNQSYQIALDGFEKLKDDERFTKVVPYYIAQIYYLQGRYQEVTEYAMNVTQDGNIFNANDVNHLIGDAFYRIGKYDEAVPYLADFNRNSLTTRDDDYQLGYAYFRSKMYDQAIRMFDKTSSIKDSLGQIALYHIGESYLKKEQNASARSAFEAASLISDNRTIQEDALYNYAILSYKLDINPYDEAVEAFELYLKRYPNSQRENDVYQYLVNVYTTTNNFEKALESLDRLPNKNTKLKSAYQVIAFNRGVELFQRGNYNGAIKALDQVEKYPIDPVVSGKAIYWSAEAWFNLNKYDKSIQVYRTFLSSPATMALSLKADAYYNIGYAYLAKNDTAQAVESFRIYTQQSNISNKKKLADANLRAADCFYMMKQNEMAVKFYQEVLKLRSGYEDQALFYMAKTYGFMPGGTAKKINHLLDIINNYENSKYILASIQEVAISYKGMGEDEKALRYFNQILKDYPAALSVKDARVEIADIYYKTGNYSRSELEYKALLTEYGQDREICEKGARGLFDIYRTLKQPEKSEKLADQYPCANFSKDEKEELYYSPAMDSYSDSAFATAIPQLEKYLDKFPDGKYANEITNYLAHSEYQLGNTEKAIEIYRKTLEGQNTGFTELAVSRVSQYLYNSGMYVEVIPYYLKLETISSKPVVIYNTRLGLMRSNFLVENWGNAVEYADKILASGQMNNVIRLEAEYARGMSNYNMKEYDKAQVSLEWIVKNTTDEKGAEAKYVLAEMYFKLEQLDKSDAEVRGLLKMKPSYHYWVAKGLILQTRTLILKNDLFQAEQTLKSVRVHYANKEDGILLEADQLWDELMQLKNTPKEVQEKGATEIEVKGN
jgi:tetratricopeptide (TPR) repeat protein